MLTAKKSKKQRGQTDFELPNLEGAFTHTTMKFWEVIKDGKPHSIASLRCCLWDDQTLDLANTVRQHMFRIREVIVKLGFDVISRSHAGEPYYVLVKYLTPQLHLID